MSGSEWVQEGRSPDSQPASKRAAEVMLARHYSRKTIKAYTHWIQRFLAFHSGADHRFLREEAVNEFLSHLAVHKRVAASTQNQALAALLFYFEHVVGRPLDRVDGVIRARKPKSNPIVLAREEVANLLSRMDGTPLLVALLLYGSGLRVGEALSLRVKDIDFKRGEVTVRRGKGGKDRVTMLPENARYLLESHLLDVRRQHRADLKAGLGRVPMPEALARKYPNADREWGWQWVFPATSHYTDPQTGVRHRHHLHASVIQKAVRQASLASGGVKHATPHVLRHSFATHVLEDGYDVCTVRDLLGHNDVRVTQVYLHVLNRGGLGVRSPLDFLHVEGGRGLRTYTDPRRKLTAED